MSCLLLIKSNTKSKCTLYFKDEETLFHLGSCICGLVEKSNVEGREQLGTCLGLLYQKLSGDVTPTEVTGDSTLIELDKDTHRNSELDKNTQRNSADTNVRLERCSTVVTEIEKMLKVLGLTNNNTVLSSTTNVLELCSEEMEPSL